MAFDVYVGTMTRFYRHEWENSAQRMARQQGIKYNMIHAGGKPPAPPATDDIRRAVAGWCKSMSGGLVPHGFGPIEWSEADDQPYFTERPSWPGYSALLVWASHAEHPDLPVPAGVPGAWVDDPAFQKSTHPDFRTIYRTILEPQLWLPADFPFVFGAPTLTSKSEQRIGSTFTLRRQLQQLQASTTAGLAGGSELAQSAAFAITVFLGLAEKACEHRLPILLDF